MEQQIHAPELPHALEWFNTDHPLTLAEQRGKVVLLDFWTYCCINCMHILPDLAWLEQKYPDSLTVIGIHSPKFPNERVGAQVQKAIQRYHIHHPVAHDPDFSVWQTYGIRSWPSIIFIDPQGYVLGVLSGEGRRRQLDMLIAESLQKAEQRGARIRSAIPLKLAPELYTALKFPGKLLATPDRLYVADSGHHRILEISPAGERLRVFGGKEAGLADGAAQLARFHEPQGLALADNKLYVADRQNHAIRCIDLANGITRTVAGTGQQGRERWVTQADPLNTGLNSPWDVAYAEGMLYIAMAGSHQIWRLDLAANKLSTYCGSGREDIVDGGPAQAALAQPSGLSLSRDALYLADSETSAVRAIRLADAHIETLVGRGLFEFGDLDGIGIQARLQHPLAVAWDAQRGGLWIADTYNSKLKFLRAADRQVSSVELNCSLDEPGGLSLCGDVLWIADTNAHRVLRYDIVAQDCHELRLAVV